MGCNLKASISADCQPFGFRFSFCSLIIWQRHLCIQHSYCRWSSGYQGCRKLNSSRQITPVATHLLGLFVQV